MACPTDRSHLTAIKRTRPSRPVHELIKRDLIPEGAAVLNYGAGKAEADDRALSDAVGQAGQFFSWDPKQPTSPRAIMPVSRWAVIYCGYVLNVLPQPERRNVVNKVRLLLDGAHPSKRLAGQRRGRAYFAVRGHGCTIPLDADVYQDGVITKRGTFQRAFTPGELAAELFAGGFEYVQPIVGGDRSAFVLVEARMV